MSKAKVSVLRLTLSLGLIAGCSAALMARVYVFTQGPIAARALKNTNKALQQLLPEFDNQPTEETLTLNSPENTPVTFYLARKGDELVGTAAEIVTGKGFSGDITVMAGLDCKGRITTVLVTRHSETPGLGSVVAERKRKKTILNLFDEPEEGLPPNPVLDQLNGLSGMAVDATTGATWTHPEGEWKLRKDGGDLDAVTGATITSRAVVDAVHQIAAAFAANHEKLRGGNDGILE